MKNIIKWAKPVIQAIISALLLGLLITCGLLPAKYLGIAAVVVLLLLLITVLSSRSDNERQDPLEPFWRLRSAWYLPLAPSICIWS